MDDEVLRVSERSTLFIDCYWDRKKRLFIRVWRYRPTTGGSVGHAWIPEETSFGPICGFAVPTKEEEEIQSALRMGSTRKRVLDSNQYGRWEEVKDSTLLKLWQQHANSIKTVWARAFLRNLNEGNYIALVAELERLTKYESEDRKALETDDIVKDYFGPKALHLRTDEPAFIREMERANLRRIIDEFEKWFYSHDIDPTKIDRLGTLIKQKDQREYYMRKLANVWNGLAAFLGALGTIFFIREQLFLGIIFAIASGILFLIPAQSEIKAKFGKRYHRIIPTVVIISIAILSYSELTRNVQSPQHETKKTSIANDTGFVDKDTTKNVPIKGASVPQQRSTFGPIDRGERIRMRAYVLRNMETGIIKSLDVGKRIEIAVRCDNTGETPAYDYYHAYKIQWEEGKEPVQKDFDELFALLDRHSHGGITIAAKSPVVKESSFDAVFSHDDSVTVFGDKVIVYLLGAITYRDAFGEKHRTWYCLSYDPARHRFYATDKFNGAN